MWSYLVNKDKIVRYQPDRSVYVRVRDKNMLFIHCQTQEHAKA